MLVPSAASAQQRVLKQDIEVNWSNGKYKGKSSKSFTVPGIGSGKLVCRPNQTWIEFTANSSSDENSLASVKFENKNGMYQPSVKNARVYQFSTPTSTQKTGTGKKAREGFNQQFPIEADSSGNLVGVFSRREARTLWAGPGAPVTYVQLSWKWEHFGYDNAKCYVGATLTTALDKVPKSMRSYAKGKALTGGLINLNWHGATDPNRNTHAKTYIQGVGTLVAECQTDALGKQSLALYPDKPGDVSIHARIFQAEGMQAEETEDHYFDPAIGSTSPLELPNNAALILEITSSKGKSFAMVSSQHKLNGDTEADNYCEIAVATLDSAL